MEFFLLCLREHFSVIQTLPRFSRQMQTDSFDGVTVDGSKEYNQNPQYLK